MLVIVNNSASHWGTGSFSILHRLALVWRPVEASTEPPNAPKRRSKPIKNIWRLLQLLGSLQKLSNVGNR